MSWAGLSKDGHRRRPERSPEHPPATLQPLRSRVLSSGDLGGPGPRSRAKKTSQAAPVTRQTSGRMPGRSPPGRPCRPVGPPDDSPGSPLLGRGQRERSLGGTQLRRRGGGPGRPSGYLLTAPRGHRRRAGLSSSRLSMAGPGGRGLGSAAHSCGWPEEDSRPLPHPTGGGKGQGQCQNARAGVGGGGPRATSRGRQGRAVSWGRLAPA